MVMTAKEFNQLVDDKQKEINEIMKVVDNIKFEIYIEANKIFREKGIEGFGELYYDPEWMGVAQLSINDPDSGEYLFPDGLNAHNSGWVPSSYL